MIKTVIIEDELHLRETNKMLLMENFPDIEIVGEAGNVAESIELIKSEKPDLVLCDIELKDGNCFQVLQKCKPYKFRPVFITAFNQYAIKAIKFSAIDYILKPVNEYEFCAAIQSAIAQLAENNIDIQTENLLAHTGNGNACKKVVLRTSESMHLVDINEILYCKSDNSYTTFFLVGEQKITVSKSIKEFAELFSEHNFLRPHQSYLVNLNAIVRIDKTDGGFIIVSNGAEIPISTRRKQLVFDQLENL
ncbi:LytR/AlgR family response regulator transcription factor [Maribellus maritimus]|uniref:LytR/AlgR family response regulator transcription factor n=1 Tax=Maribellus maritimus TaxID=2870838 RepID=UPI001EEB2F71|nr:LytTR family DNA-binding domain-containing protein [Maribellus maritimus]MCG6188680.1 LytTR family DNA-binding domain-containing protein [Maribellus maritimus]